MQNHNEQLTLELQQAAATYINTVSNKTSLITVTRAELGEKGAMITLYVSVYPEDAEGPAMGFLMRKRGECRAYLKQHVPARRIPHVEFELDKGEKSRRRVDELLGS